MSNTITELPVKKRNPLLTVLGWFGIILGILIATASSAALLLWGWK